MITYCDKDPEQRERFNDPESPTPANPTARDFGYLVRDMANSLRTWSFQLHRLSDQLIRDEALPEPMSKGTLHHKLAQLIRYFRVPTSQKTYSK